MHKYQLTLPVSCEETKTTVDYTDFFCGIGGFRYAIEQVSAERGLISRCVFSSDIDPHCQEVYHANFGERPLGDIRAIPDAGIPAHDVLLAGFPCQPFSICGDRKGFDDTRGTLFFEIVRVLNLRKPSLVILENVKLLRSHDRGKTLQRIRECLTNLGYDVYDRVLNALDYGLPQKRERVFIVGFRIPHIFAWPPPQELRLTLDDILESDVPEKYYVSERIRRRNSQRIGPVAGPTIWHENKAGHVSAYPFSCALRAGASYNYLLVDGIRRLTPREMLRLQGFPEKHRIVSSDAQTRKQAGNAVPVPLAAAVIRAAFDAVGWRGRPEAKRQNLAGTDHLARVSGLKP